MPSEKEVVADHANPLLVQVLVPENQEKGRNEENLLQAKLIVQYVITGRKVSALKGENAIIGTYRIVPSIRRANVMQEMIAPFCTKERQVLTRAQAR